MTTDVKNIEFNGTTYNAKTPKAVINTLENALRTKTRVRLFYGDTKTGVAWAEENDVSGNVGRSTGKYKVPLIVSPNSHGGPYMLDHCIVGIVTQHGWAYKHPSLDLGTWAHGPQLRDGFIVVTHNGKSHARFTTQAKAERYIAFMTGKRIAK